MHSQFVVLLNFFSLKRFFYDDLLHLFLYSFGCANVELTRSALGHMGARPGVTDARSMYEMNVGKNADPCNEIRAT